MPSPESLALRRLLLDQAAAQAGTQPSIEEMRQGLEAMMGAYPVDPRARIQALTIDGMPAEWVIAPNAGDGVLLYLHGGGYCLGSFVTCRDLAARLSAAGAVRVLVPGYRLAPEHPFPAAVDDAVRAYRWLVAAGVSPERIAVGGDSAGGGLTLALFVSLRDAGDPLPAAGVLLSPWTDMEGTGESMATRAPFDPWLKPQAIRAMALLYTGDTDVRHPLVSPIYADLHGLPPLLVHAGRDECLLDDSVRLVERARTAGVAVTLKIWEDMWHVFQGFAYSVPEARQAIAEIGVFVAAQLGAIKPAAIEKGGGIPG